MAAARSSFDIPLSGPPSSVFRWLLTSGSLSQKLPAALSHCPGLIGPRTIYLRLSSSRLPSSPQHKILRHIKRYCTTNEWGLAANCYLETGPILLGNKHVWHLDFGLLTILTAPSVKGLNKFNKIKYGLAIFWQ